MSSFCCSLSHGSCRCKNMGTMKTISVNCKDRGGTEFTWRMSPAILSTIFQEHHRLQDTWYLLVTGFSGTSLCPLHRMLLCLHLVVMPISEPTKDCKALLDLVGLTRFLEGHPQSCWASCSILGPFGIGEGCCRHMSLRIELGSPLPCVAFQQAPPPDSLAF